MSHNFRSNGGTCTAVGCSMRRGTNLLSQVKMFSFPTDPVRRAAWCNSLKRENWFPTNNSLICNAHFISGKPSFDPEHPDYVPSIFSFRKIAAEEGEKIMKCYKRNAKRSRSQSVNETSSSIGQIIPNVDSPNVEDWANEDPVPSNESSIQTNDIGVQTDMNMLRVKTFEKQFRKLKQKIQSLKKENNELRKKATETETYASIINSGGKRFKFHTGLENLNLFFHILNFLLTVWKPTTKVNLNYEEQFLLVLMKLRLGLKNQDLATRFCIRVGSVSKVFHEWLDIMFVNFEKLIVWPSKKKSLKICHNVLKMFLLKM